MTSEINSFGQISTVFKKETYARGTLLLKQGDPSLYTYHVISGCLRSYVIDSSGKEHIIQFAPENWLVTDMNSFLNDTDSVLNIDVIEESEVVVIDKRAISLMKQSSKELLLEELKRCQNNIIAHQNRIITLLSATAEERYVYFMKTYPLLYQRLPLKMVAAYLGITPEFLSRIRKNMQEK